jgi:hypothetical protein
VILLVQLSCCWCAAADEAGELLVPEWCKDMQQKHEQQHKTFPTVDCNGMDAKQMTHKQHDRMWQVICYGRTGQVLTETWRQPLQNNQLLDDSMLIALTDTVWPAADETARLADGSSTAAPK